LSAARPPQPVAVLISGRGGNMHALVEDSSGHASPYEVTLVISNQPSAAGLEIAQSHAITTRVVAADRGTERAVYDRTLAAAIDESAPALIVLAGFMRILSAEFVDRYAGRILNIHPSLLPKYPGLHTHRRALDAGDAVHGATVHFVTAELDGGPPVVQGRVKIQPGDDEATLAARVQTAEHRVYPLAVRWYCEGRLRCREDGAWLDGKRLEAPVQYDFPMEH
jgi:phosphoribosylglycinamide formyltransferase 1